MPSTDAFDRSAWSAIEIGLPVDVIEPMRRFYVDGLGFTPAAQVDLPVAHIEAFRFGDCLLKLTLFRDPAMRPSKREPDPREFYLSLRMFDLDETVRRCEAAGISPIAPVAESTSWDMRTVRFAFVIDPMGNRIELVEGNAWSA